MTDRHTGERRQEKDICLSLLDPQMLRPASVSRTLPQWQSSFPCKQEQGFLVDFIVLNDSSISVPCCFPSRTGTLMKAGIHSCYNSSSRCLSLKASPVSLSWASFIPWTTVKQRFAGGKVWSRSFIFDNQYRILYFRRNMSGTQALDSRSGSRF